LWSSPCRQADPNAKEHDSEYEAMARTLKYQRDLTPGDVFGEEVLAGERLRNTTALALTVVDLLVIEDDDFQAAEDPTGGGLTVDERVDLVMQSSLCRGLDHYRAFKVRPAPYLAPYLGPYLSPYLAIYEAPI
jgi:hypothetical protein